MPDAAHIPRVSRHKIPTSILCLPFSSFILFCNFNGGPVGLNNLAAMVGEESETVETVCEPYLVREGFLIRTPKGRVATAKAWSHLGLEPQGETNGEDVSKLF